MNNNYWKEYWDSYYNFMDFYINELQNVYPYEDIEDKYIEVAKLFEPSIRPNNYIPPVIQSGGQGQGTQQGNQGQNNVETQSGNQVQWPGAQSGGIYGQGMQQGAQGQGQGMQQGNQGQGQGMQQGNQGQGQGMQQGNQGQGQGMQQGGQGQGQGTQQGNTQGMQSQNQLQQWPAPPFNQGLGPVQPPMNQGPGPAISPGGGQFTINNCKKMSVVRIVMRSGFNPSSFYMLVDRTDRRSIQGYRIAHSEGRIRFVPMSVEYRNINFIECVF